MKSLSVILATLVTVFSSLGMAQGPNTPEAERQFQQEGKLLVFRYVPGDKKGKLFIVGKKAAELDLNKDAKLVSITAFEKGREETLMFTKEGDAYLLPKIPTSHDAVLDIKAEVRGQMENVKIKLKP